MCLRFPLPSLHIRPVACVSLCGPKANLSLLAPDKQSYLEVAPIGREHGVGQIVACPNGSHDELSLLYGCEEIERRGRRSLLLIWSRQEGLGERTWML